MGRAANRVIAAGALVLSLAGCNPFAPFAPTETEILRAGTVEPDRFPAPEPVFCYDTLAAADCFRTPRRGEAHRLVGAYRPVFVIR